MMYSANKEIKNINDIKSNIVTGSFLSDLWDIPFIDMYHISFSSLCNIIRDAGIMHQLSSLWLRYVDDYRDLREGQLKHSS